MASKEARPGGMPHIERPIDGSETFHVVQDGDSRHASLDDVFAAVPPGPPGASNNTFLTRAAIAALSVLVAFPGNSAMLTEAGREGAFVFRATDFVAELGSSLAIVDPDKAVFIPPASDPTGASGAWVRKAALAAYYVSTWWGVSIDATAAANKVNYRAALDTLAKLALTAPGYVNGNAATELYTPPAHGEYLFDDQLQPESAVKMTGITSPLGGGTIFTWTGSSGSGISLKGWDGVSRHSSGSEVSGVHLKGPYAGVRSAMHGIYVNCTTKIENVFCENWPGHGVYGFGDTATTNGNLNLSTFRNIYAQFCDCTLVLQGGDANACVVQGIRAQSNRLGSYWDWSFLGNSADGIHAENCGLETNYRSRCEMGGHIYVVAYGQELWCSTNSPTGTATSNQGWLYLMEGGTNFYTATWATGQTWYFTAPVSIGPPDNGNTLGRAEGCYIEGGMNPIILGPHASCKTTTTAVIWCDADLATHHGTPHGGTWRGEYETMVLGNGLTIPGLITQLGPRQELGASSGVAADYDMNYHCTNYSVRLNATRHDSDGTPHAMGSLIWFNGQSFLDATYSHAFRVSGSGIVNIDTTGLIAAVDNVMNLGGASNRFANAYVASGVLNTSDRNDKEQVRPLTDPEFALLLEAVRAVPLVAFKFKDAVAAKAAAGLEARDHYGIIAQDLADALEARGLDPFAGGVLGKDPVVEDVEELVTVERPVTRKQTVERKVIAIKDGRAVSRLVTDEIDVPVTELLPVVDESGNPVLVPTLVPQPIGEDGTRPPATVEYVQAMHETSKMETAEVMQTVTKPKLDENGGQVYRYNVRYQEFWTLRFAAIAGAAA